MLCEKCEHKRANIHYRLNINGINAEMNLCGDCYEELVKENNIPNFNYSFLSDLIDNAILNARRSARRNCIKNYLDNDIEENFFNKFNIFNSNNKSCSNNVCTQKKYENEKEHKLYENCVRTNRINDLKIAQQKMIKEENYEEAAKIRDEIKILNSQNNIN